MGDQIRKNVDEVLYYVPQRVFEALRGAAGAEHRAGIFANLCRINALYMLALSGTGRVGSAFSSLDMVSWLLLDELDDNQPGRRGATRLATDRSRRSLGAA